MRPTRDLEAELTLRGVGLGALITVVFMAANIYLGLKTGITFSSSIPAAVISMGLLKLTGGGSILENNIVQTQASAAGTLCNVNLVLPGLVLIDYWHSFPLWQTMALCLLGGLFGVAFSVPLRRVMVVDSDLPFPEGVAAAEVLLSGHGRDGPDAGGGLRELGLGAFGAALFGFLMSGFRLLPDQIGGSFTVGRAVFRLDGGLSLALVGIGYLVRIGCCMALLIGIVIAWGIAVPILTSALPIDSDPRAAAEFVWASKVRLIGAGLIAVAGLWTVATLLKPMVAAIRAGLRKATPSRGAAAPRDIPMGWVGMAVALLLVPLAALLWVFAADTGIEVPLLALVPALTLLAALFGLLMATACGYLAGLLGSSSSPISGIGILTVMLLAGCGFAVLPSAASGDARLVGALTLFVASFVVTASSIANDNLQDLKAGQLVGATPWKQQAALVIGVVIGAATIAPVLELLYNAYGFPGALPRPGMDPRDALPAPQAALLAQIADGIVRHQLDWTMVAIGGGLGAIFVAVEAALRRRGITLPALSVGIGMYLPCSAVLTIAVGGILGWLAERAAHASGKSVRETLRRRGVLLSSGFLVGESLVGITIAFSDLLQARSNSLALRSSFPPAARDAAAILIFTGILMMFYRSVTRLQSSYTVERHF